MTKPGFKPRPLSERFWEKVDKRGPDECWPWLGAPDNYGYGHIRVGDRMTGAHRVAYEMANGPLPDGLCALHSCDNPPCVNDAHLFAGTRADNSADMDAKGRRRKPAAGAQNGRAKISAEQARDIRRMSGTQSEIAAAFGIKQAQVSRIKRGTRWRVEGAEVNG